VRKLRVAHVITRLCKGGAQENTFHTVRLANADRYEVDLISGPTRGAEGSIEAAIEDAGITIHRIPHLVRLPSPLQDWLAYKAHVKKFQERNYDIVHTHTSKAGILGRLAAAKVGVPVIVHTPHGNIFHGYFNRTLTRLFVWLERHASRRTDRIIELTPGGIKEYLAEGIGQREQFVVIFSGIDVQPYEVAAEKREKTRAALGIQPDHILLGGVGRLERVKGFTYFLEAAQKVAKAVPEARFILVGEGALRKSLEDQAAPLGDRIKFLGLREDVPDLMAATDILVAPSLNEGMGRVLLEAGAAGTPAVASDVGGIPDIIDDGETGILVQTRDADSLARALIELSRAPERRKLMGDTARAKVVPHFSLETMVTRIEALYEELINEKYVDSGR
jgi:glycosyltransferase involved in cell wall biosynthesis